MWGSSDVGSPCCVAMLPTLDAVSEGPVQNSWECGVWAQPGASYLILCASFPYL